MKKLLIILMMLSLTACFQSQEDFLFTGLFVEFDAITYSLDPENFSIPLEDGQGEVMAQVNLVGAHQDADEIIRFAVDPASTAVAGQHYQLDDFEVLIPANSSFSELTFEVLDTDLPAGETVTLTLVLEGSERIEPMENYRQQTYIIYGN